MAERGPAPPSPAGGSRPGLGAGERPQRSHSRSHSDPTRTHVRAQRIAAFGSRRSLFCLSRPAGSNLGLFLFLPWGAAGYGTPPAPLRCSLALSPGAKPGEKPGEEPAGDSPKAENESQPLHGSGICKWFNVRMGFGFLSMTAKGGATLDSPVDVFVHQSKLHMEGFRSLKEGEAVEFTFKKSSKGLESIRVTGPGGVFCIGSERRPKGKSLQKRRSKGDRCYNCGGLDHHAKECKLPPQPKKCHFCQSISHMVANCPAKAQQSPSSQGKPASFHEEEDMHSSALLPETRE
ncbi:protein lin-28 homolog A [Phasianus colchicus]|uniref:protein lin-28 homolog A n=1 Tax=Phasianus colchicus TaxID=9054 RepID=UPI00129D62A0|nr:protein lin-28 homolog A [Phasianus colchicus]